MPTVERTARQEALLQHLGPDREHLVPVCNQAVSLLQAAVDGGEDQWHLLQTELTLPNGRTHTVEEVVTIYHLNSFVRWGGEENL